MMNLNDKLIKEINSCKCMEDLTKLNILKEKCWNVYISIDGNVMTDYQRGDTGYDSLMNDLVMLDDRKLLDNRDLLEYTNEEFFNEFDMYEELYIFEDIYFEFVDGSSLMLYLGNVNSDSDNVEVEYIQGKNDIDSISRLVCFSLNEIIKDWCIPDLYDSWVISSKQVLDLKY